MATVLTIANQKGGVTKSTTCGMLAFLLGKMGFKILVTDLDPQSNLTQLITQVDDVDEELLETNIATGTIFDALLARDPRSFIMQGALDNIDLIISNDDVANLTSFLYSEDYKGHVSLCLSETLKVVQDDYDFILVDTPPTLGELLSNGLGAADCILIPVDTSRYSKSGLKRIFHTTKMIKEHVNPHLEILGILPSAVNRNRKDTRKAVEDLKEHHEYNKFILPTEIPYKASLARLSVTGFKNNREILDDISIFLPILEVLLKRVEENQATACR